jgi:quercetin dioxygenase-like cupin family protein
MTASDPVDVGGGVFISRVTTEDFEPDPDVPGTEQHVLYAGAELSAGMSRIPADGDPITWTLPQREVLLVLEGTARIQIKDGPTLNLRAGDMATLPAGLQTTWHVSAPFKEFWVLG